MADCVAMRAALGFVLGCAMVLISARTHAEERAQTGQTSAANAAAPGSAFAPSGAEPTPAPWLKPGVLAAGVALVPGIVLHGAGSFSIGDRKAAKRLLIAEATGLAVFVGAGLLMVQTGTARRLIGALTPLAVAGFGVFALTWLADVYAASSGGRDAYGPRFVPNVEVQLGYLYVHDPQFAYGSFATLRGDLRASAFRASPEAAIALDDDNQRVLLELGYRPLGRTPTRGFRDGSFVELATGVRYHRFGSDGFAVISSEWHVDGRLDLARVGSTLRGAFVEGQLGAAFELYQFDAPGSRVENNAFGLLLARFGFGVYIGTGPQSGEAQLYYDHRHDDFAAGLGVQGIASGPLGHFGLSGRYFFTPAWGVAALAELGSALVAGASACYRFAPHAGGAP
jgi:hypothetical protein